MPFKRISLFDGLWFFYHKYVNVFFGNVLICDCEIDLFNFFLYIDECSNSFANASIAAIPAND